jgi:ABC-2 type transport system ATP-binding protein
VSFQVAGDEIFGLLGRHGAGKTTTLFVLPTLLRAYSGTAAVCGVDVGRHGMQVRQAIGYMPA